MTTDANTTTYKIKPAILFGALRILIAAPIQGDITNSNFRYSIGVLRLETMYGCNISSICFTSPEGEASIPVLR